MIELHRETIEGHDSESPMRWIKLIATDNRKHKTKERKDEIEISFLASFLLETKPVRGILLHQKGKSGKTIHEYGCIITCLNLKIKTGVVEN